MTPSQLFGVVVRTIGLLLTVSGGIWTAIGLVTVFFGGGELLLAGILVLPMGLWLLKRPEFFIALAYGDAGTARSGEI